MADKNYLESWSVLNKYIDTFTEDQCSTLLKEEQKGRRRVQFIIRLYGRYNRLRTTRERDKLFQR